MSTLQLVRQWLSSQTEFDRNSVGADFINIANIWNDHNNGFRYWDNLNARNALITNATIGTLTVTGTFPYLLLAGGTLTGNLAFSPTTKGITGTTTNDAAAAGVVGEYTSARDSGGQNSPATANWGDASSLSLTAGDWDVTGTVYWNRAGSTWTEANIGMSTTSGNSTTGLNIGDNYFVASAPAATLVDSYSLYVPAYRYSLSATTTVYLKVMSRFTVGTPGYYYRISARRIR